MEQELKLFCNNLSTLRKREKLSLTHMASKLNISVKSLKLLEAGTLPPRLSTAILFAIQKNFGVAPRDMFTLSFVQRLPLEGKPTPKVTDKV